MWRRPGGRIVPLALPTATGAGEGGRKMKHVQHVKLLGVRLEVTEVEGVQERLKLQQGIDFFPHLGGVGVGG